MQEYKITIPIEIVNVSKVNFSKPVYIYWSETHLLCISNKKKRNYCFGQISVDKEYTFILTQNIVQSILDRSDYTIFVKRGKIYIRPHSGYYSERNIVDTFTIPKEILKICNIDFSKSVYLGFSSSQNRYYLSNYHDRSFSLGRISFYENYSFYLSSNIRKTLGVSSAEQLSVYVSGSRLYFKRYTTDIY